jgi:peptide/nickel transport system substrate-binding protein
VVHGGTATVAVPGLPTTLNPYAPQPHAQVAWAIGSLLWPSPFEVTPTLTVVERTDTITAAEVTSVNPLTVVYRVDPRAVWSNGEPIGAADFVALWQAERGGTLGPDGQPVPVASTIGYRDIASVSGSGGGRTVTVVFRTPFADWEALFDELLPASVLATQPFAAGFAQGAPGASISGGPYKVASMSPTRLVLVRNPRWWGPRPALDRIVFVAASAGTGLAEALRDGAVQVAWLDGAEPDFLASVSSVPYLESQTNLGTRILELAYNTTEPPFDLVAVRQAIAKLLDRAAIVEQVAQPIDPWVWEDNDHLFANAQAAYADGASGYHAPNPSEAARLLDGAGFARSPGGRWSYDGRPVVLRLAWASDEFWAARTGPIVADELEAAGFAVQREAVPEAMLLDSVLPSRSFDLAIVSVDAGAFPTMLERDFTPLGGANVPVAQEDWSGYDNPQVDALFAEAANTLNPNAAAPLYARIDRILWQEMPTLPLFAAPSVLVADDALVGVSDDVGGWGPLWDATGWAYLEPLGGGPVPTGAPAATMSPSAR